MEEMQDKLLNEKESLELISRMIRNTQQKMKEGSGVAFLIWGYTTIFVTMLVWLLLMFTHNYQWQWLWFLLPVCGTLMLVYHNKRNKSKSYVSTYVDTVVGYIWWVLGITGFLLSTISIIIHRIPILFIIVLIMGIGTALTGLVIKFRPVAVSGFVGMGLSVALIFLDGCAQMPFFAFIFLLMMVIPGHYLNYKAKKRNV